MLKTWDQCQTIRERAARLRKRRRDTTNEALWTKKKMYVHFNSIPRMNKHTILVCKVQPNLKYNRRITLIREEFQLFPSLKLLRARSRQRARHVFLSEIRPSKKTLSMEMRSSRLRCLPIRRTTHLIRKPNWLGQTRQHCATAAIASNTYRTP